MIDSTDNIERIEQMQQRALREIVLGLVADKEIDQKAIDTLIELDAEISKRREAKD